MKTLNYFGNVAKAPNSALDKMKEEGVTFITWRNSFTNTRFVATLNYVSIMANNKLVGWRNAAELPENEIKDLGMDLCTDEILFEMMANDVEEIEIKEGFGSATKVSINDLDVSANVNKAEKEITASKQAKEFGLKSLTQVSELTGQSLQTLTNWFNHKPELFKIVLLGCKYKTNSHS